MKKILSASSIWLMAYGLWLMAFPSTALAQNKCGVNIGPNYSQVGQVSNLVKAGGWVVALGTPGDCSNFESLFGKGLNVVIRAYNGGRTFTNEQALGWVATLGHLNTKGQKVYFMPWNEPNHTEEGGEPGAGSQVYAYSQFLKNALSEAGLLESKVVLLSPMVDKTNQSFINQSFFTNPGGKPGFYGLFDGSSINEYDFFPACSAEPALNNCRYDQIGIPAPYFALEAGVAGTTALPRYQDDQIRQMLDISWSQKWSSDPNFQMFAIFSYDPHRPGSWNLFSASDTTNFYRNFCSTGGVTPGSSDVNQFSQWFAKYQNQLVSCGGCGWAPSLAFCSSAGKTTQEVIKAQNSLVCTDFDINYANTRETVVTPTPQVQGENTGPADVAGTVTLNDSGLPDFSLMEKNLSLALTKLLPEALRQTLSLDATPLGTQTKHFVQGKETSGFKPGKPAEIPETKMSLPAWWTTLLGQSKILCGIFNTCQAPKSLAIKVEAPTAKVASAGGRCPSENLVKDEKVGNQTIKREFSTKSLFSRIASLVERLIDNITRLVQIDTESTTLTNKTRGNLPGGTTFNQNASFFDYALPQEFAASTKGAPLPVNAQFQTKVGTGGTTTTVGDDKKISYQKLGKARFERCLHLCSLYPAGFNISSIDPLCPSCNPSSYPSAPSAPPVKDVALDMSSCQKDPSGACDYVDPSASPRCEGDPICESGKCYPLQWRQAKDYLSRGCPLPYPGNDCTDSSVCQKVNFEKNPAGGYGLCQYQKSESCVRTDREEVGNCAALCNWACCVYQE